MDAQAAGDRKAGEAAGGHLLIYAPVPVHRAADGGFLVEAQAANGLGLWAANFRHLTVMMPLGLGPAPAGWVPAAAIGPALERITIEPLPMAYRPDRFLRALPAGRRRIRALIGGADYLSFAIGGLFGDWGAVAAFEARAMGRPFAVWTDRVESEVTRRGMSEGSWRRRLRARLTHRPMAWLERAVVRRAALGLFHGRETFDAYAPHCQGPVEIVHDIHLAADDHIPAPALRAKVASVGEGPLRVVYVGRAEAMKGPLDWIDALARAAARGVDLRATWLGDGSLRPDLLRRIAEAGLSDRVAAPGFSSDRGAVLEALREAQVFLFCHKTPESPRCLIEALASGTPIVGYSSAYPSGLIEDHGGGLLVPRDDVGALAAALEALASDRTRLADLIERAAADGAPFSDVAVFRHRSDVIKRHLAPA